MKVLVTGSAGFIGQHLCAELTRRGHETVPFDRPAWDVRDFDRLELVCRTSGAGAVVNLAGMLGTPELFGSEQGPARSTSAGRSTSTT